MQGNRPRQPVKLQGYAHNYDSSSAASSQNTPAPGQPQVRGLSSTPQSLQVANNKMRKASAHRLVALHAPHYQLDPASIALMKNHLGNLQQSQSKERKSLNSTMLAKITQKSAMGSNDQYNKLQAKRHSKTGKSGGGQFNNSKKHTREGDQRGTNSTSDQIYNYTEETDELQPESNDYNYFGKLENAEDDMRVEDYNDSLSVSQHLLPSDSPNQKARVPDYGHAPVNLRKNHTAIINCSSDYSSIARGHRGSRLASAEDDGFKVPVFAGRGSLEQPLNHSNNSKDQFYMTQLLNVHGGSNNQRSGLTNKTVIVDKPSSQLGAVDSLGMGRELKGSRDRKIKTSSTAMMSSKTKAGIQAHIRMPDGDKKKKKQIYNTNIVSANATMVPPIYREDTAEGMTSNQRHSHGKISDVYATQTQVHTSQKDFFNSTAPLSMSILFGTKMLSETSGTLPVEVGGSSQILGRINSTGGVHVPDLGLPAQQYYANTGAIERKGSRLGLSSVSPVKMAKKQMLIQSILNQELQKSQGKLYLNMTLQQLMQQNHEGYGSNDHLHQQKRLNKTLDSKDYNNGVKRKRQSQQQLQLPGNPGKSKFSSTMRFSDFNQTQQLAANDTQNEEAHKELLNRRAVGGRKSKNSLKSTQNLHLGGEDKKIGFNQHIAHSTTSQNQPQISKTATKKVTSKFEETQKPKSQHRKQSSQVDTDKDILKKMMNFYQDDFLMKFRLPSAATHQGTIVPPFSNTRLSVNNAQGTTISVGQGKRDSVSKSASKNQIDNKHKAHSTLNQYIKNSNSKAATALSIHKLGVTELPESKDKSSLSRAASKEKKVELNYSSVGNIEKQLGRQDVHPYNYFRINNQHPPAKLQSPKGMKKHQNLKEGFAYEEEPGVRDFQNKTQPIPKSVLDMTNFAANQIISGSGQISIPTKAVAQKRVSQVEVHKRDRQIKGDGKVQNIQITTFNQSQPIKIQQIQNSIGTQAQVPPNKPEKEKPEEPYKNKQTAIVKEENDHPLTSQEEYCDEQSSELNEQYSSGSESDGNVKLSRFILGKQIGQGAYAVVRIATRKSDNKKFAIKVYDKSKLTDANRQRSVRREIKLLQKMSHPNIVKIYEAFETDDFVYLLMEYVGGGSLHSYLREKPQRRLEEDDARRIFKQILTALQYCHRKCIAHRDIKLENILLDDQNNVKLIDFGFSTCIPNDKKIKMFCGTPSYMAPEIVLKEEYAGPPADIWASAVLLYALMNSCFPFRGATDKELYRRIQRGTFALHNQTVSDQYVEILSRMLNTTADERPTAEELLQDSWFSTDANQKSSNALAMKSHAESIAEQKRLFKEKILGKAGVEKKSKNTICLNLPQQQPEAAKKPEASGFGGTQTTEFSDYGLPQTTNIKKLNQEAYQAYYNTSGATFGVSGSGTIQNPYYNNFFQNNYAQGVYSPNSGPNAKQEQQTTYNFQANNNITGTPQVFGSPTGAAFNLSGGLINNNFNIPCGPRLQNWLEIGKDKQVNFNIINNIIMNSQQPMQMPGGVTQGGACVSPQPQRAPDSNEQPLIQPTQDQQNETYQREEEDIDEEILESLTNLGFNKSQVVSHLLHPTSQIGQLYSRLKEDKLSKTIKGRAFSQQTQVRRLEERNHNFGIFCDPPEEEGEKGKGTAPKHLFEGADEAYKSMPSNAQIPSNDYNIMKTSGAQKSPRVSAVTQIKIQAKQASRFKQ